MTAAPGTQPYRAWGERPIRVAVAGAGFVTPFHIAGWQAVEGVSVVALCALDPAQTQARAAAFDIPGVFVDLEAMLDAEQPDVLDICTPPAMHGEHIRAAAERGIHVMCQKPLAPSLAEARTIACRTRGIRLMVHENFRFRPWYREAARLLQAGTIGAPYYCRSDGRMAGTILTEAHPDTPYSVQRQPYFGHAKPLLLLDSVIHQIDTCRFLLGEPESVYARHRRVSPMIQGEDMVTLHLSLPGIEAVIERSYASRGYGDPMPSESVAIEGTRGTLFIERDGSVRTEIDVPGERRSDRMSFDAKQAYPQSYAATIAHFVARLRAGEAFETDLDDNLKTLEVVFAAYRSAERNQVVRLPSVESRETSVHSKRNAP